jgi:hypothetical protein
MTYGKSYLGTHGKPNWIPIIKVEQGKETKDFFDIVKK